MNTLSIKTKLWFLVISLMTVLALSTAWLFERLYSANQSIASIYSNQVVPLKLMADITTGYIDKIQDPLEKLQLEHTTTAEAARTVEGGMEQVQRNWQTFMATELFAEEHAIVARANPLVQQASPVIAQMLQLLRSDQAAAAIELQQRTLAPILTPLLNELHQISAVQLVNAQNTANRSKADMQTLFLIVGIAVIVVFVACITGAFLLIRRITRNLDHAVEVAERVASGDLTADIHITSQDETGRLLTALRSMNTNLVQIVRQIRDSSESIVMGSSEISTGNNDLSQRTEEQASNLQQTAASMEQLASTVRLNSDNATQATQLSSRASSTAGQGGEAMQRVNQTMGHISSSSKKIADIIGVIDSIAFQTNILALNAAVEAARAGEQGRGFAVVAGEVRNLASRSAEAAKEIKALISQSVEQVDHGAQLVDETTQTMNAIVHQVREVATLIGAISTASEEQSQGLLQVSDAVAQLDQVTQQNAALVEESAAAAASLNQQAQDLNRVVAAFKLQDQGGTRPAAVRQHLMQASAFAPARAPTATPTAPPKPAAPKAVKTSTAPASLAAPARPVPAKPNPATEDDWETF